MNKIIITALTLSLTSTFAQASSSNRNHSRVFGKIQELKTQVDANTASIQSLSDIVANLPTGGGSGGGTVPAGLVAQVQSNTDAINALSTQVQSHSSTLANHAAQIQANTSNINGMSAQVQGNTTTNNAQAAQIQANSDKNAAQDTSIQANTNKNTAQDASIQANTDKNSAQDTSIQANTNKNAAQDASIQANTDKNSAQDTSIQANSSAVNNASAQIATLQSDLNATNTQVQTNSSNIASNTNRILALESNTGGGGSTPPPPTGTTPTTIDFVPYVPPVGIKEFQETSSAAAACSIIRHEISRIDNANDSDIHITETYTNGFINCSIIDKDYKLTATALSVTTYKDHLKTNTITYDNPGHVLNDQMEVGKTFGYAASNIANLSQIDLQTSTVLGIENVSVPAGSFTNCLKLYTKVKSNMVIPNYEGVSWHCPNVGEVKRVYHDRNANTYVTRRLTNIQ